MIGVLVGLSVMLMVVGLYMILTHRRRVLDAVILSNYSSRVFLPFDEARGIFDALAEKLDGMAGIFLRNEKQREKLENMLDQAGERITAERLISRQLAGGMAGVVLGGIGLLAGKIGVITMLFFGLYGLMYPRMILNRKWRQRRKQMEDDLLPFVDMLALMIETGASMFSGMEKSAKAVGGPLGAEIESMLKMSQQQGFTEALHRMAQRLKHPVMDGFATILAQAFRYGAGMDVVHSLRQYSFALRTQKRNDIDRQVQKMGVKIMFPIFFFILIPMMAVLFSPVLASFGRSGLL